MLKIEKVREVGFELANDWFINEACASTFVLKHQNEVMNLTPPEFHKEEVVRKAWEFIKDQYLSITVDCVKPGELATYLKEWKKEYLEHDG